MPVPVRHLEMESLESRHLLYGGVTASVAGDVLSLAGDALPNYLVLWNNAQGDLVVAGGKLHYDTDGSTTTLLNGSLNPLVFPGFNGTIDIAFGGSDDKLFVSNLALSGDLRIQGDGNAHVLFFRHEGSDTPFGVNRNNVVPNAGPTMVRGPIDIDGALDLSFEEFLVLDIDSQTEFGSATSPSMLPRLTAAPAPIFCTWASRIASRASNAGTSGRCDCAVSEQNRTCLAA